MKMTGWIRWIMVFLLGIAGATAVVLSFFILEHLQQPIPPLEKVILANGQVFLSAPVYIAQENGFFRKEGVDLTIQEYSSGKNAIDFLLDGKADFATSAETPIIHASLEGKKVKIFATMASTSADMGFICSRGKPFIPQDPSGLYRIGTVLNSTMEYFLKVLFLYKDIEPAGMQISNVEPEDMLRALQSHTIDAAALWEPQASLIQQELGPDFTVKHQDGLYAWTWNLAGSPEMGRTHRLTTLKILRALRRACDFIHRHPERARQITAKYMGIPENLLEPLWFPFKFDLKLTQETLLDAEAQIRWQLSKAAPDTQLNALSLFAAEPLRELDPEAVTLIRTSS